jgi:alkylhydroperoxidase/carboxymuconolactone decarboxylase family protein YurZ
MTVASLETTTLDADTTMLVRIAALAAVDAPPASYVMNLGPAAELGIGEDEVRSVLAAIAPIVGTAKVVSATGNILRALGFILEMGEMEAAQD